MLHNSARKLAFTGTVTIILISAFCWILLVKYRYDQFNAIMDKTRSIYLRAENIASQSARHLNITEPKRNDNNIFFVETFCAIEPKISAEKGIVLNSRQACAVESAARTNPKSNIYLIYTCPVNKNNIFTYHPVVKKIFSYRNVHLYNINMEEYFSNTPLQNWFESGILKKSKWPAEHASDALRFLTLWKYGGYYLDLDFIVIRSLESLVNFVCPQSGLTIASAALHLTTDGVGKEVANRFVQEFADTYRPYEWPYNGPLLVTRVLDERCNHTKVKRLVLLILFVLVVVLWIWYAYYQHNCIDKISNRVRFISLSAVSNINYFVNNVSISFPRRSSRNIFFIESSCSLTNNEQSENEFKLNPRQACAIESAARTNPKSDIYLLYTCSLSRTNFSASLAVKQIFGYKNVHVTPITLQSYFSNTPLEAWLSDGQLCKSKYPVEHSSDVIRLVTLWKYGGLYLDLDFVVVRSLENEINFAASEDSHWVSNAAIHLAPDDVGHLLGSLFLTELTLTYNPYEWGYNGPKLLTRVLENVCQVSNISLMTKENCNGFRVLDKSTFYPVHWKEWKLLMKEKYVGRTQDLISKSFAVHLWNAQSKLEPVITGSNVMYAILAEQYCPRVYFHAGKYF